MFERSVDLNVDVGEGCGNDAALFELVTSANIACGWHAGDEETMRETVWLAMQRGVALGAHPSYPDREYFGRVSMARSPDEVYIDVSAQLEALAKIVREEGGALHHVKAHGALYNTASRDPRLAEAIVRAVRDFDSSLAVVGLAGGALIEGAQAMGMRAVSEGFADRRYLPDGTLVPRDRPDAFIADATEALSQTLRLVDKDVQTICIHGDGPHALIFAQALREGLIASGIRIAAP